MGTRNRIVVFLIVFIAAGVLGVLLATVSPPRQPGIEKLLDELGDSERRAIDDEPDGG